MITPAAESYYTIIAHGEAAELITSVFSPGSMCDILNVMVRSRDFSNDIEPINESDEAIQTIKAGLGGEIQIETRMNPLFVPMEFDALDALIESEWKSENIKFLGLDGNPFAVKSVKFNSGDKSLLSSVVSYNQFDMPAYEVIMEKQTKYLAN